MMGEEWVTGRCYLDMELLEEMEEAHQRDAKPRRRRRPCTLPSDTLIIWRVIYGTFRTQPVRGGYGRCSRLWERCCVHDSTSTALTISVLQATKRESSFHPLGILNPSDLIRESFTHQPAVEYPADLRLSPCGRREDLLQELLAVFRRAVPV